MIDWVLKIHRRPLNDIESGRKDIEGRVPDPKDAEDTYELMEEGDYIRFKITEKDKNIFDGMKYPIKRVEHYDEIESMLKSEGLNRVLPDVDTIEEGIKRYHTFPGYKKRAKEYGIYAIELGEPEHI